MGTLDGRVAVVTGGAGGIGACYARHLSACGATVVVVDLDGDGAQAVADELVAVGGQAWGRGVDIVDGAATAAVVDEVVGRAGRLDVLVNNAAVFKDLARLPAEDLDLAVWRRVLDVNVTGTYLMCRAVIPHMKRQRHGRIVNQSSGTAWTSPPLSLHYNTSKGALIPFTRSLARELGEFGVTVNAIAPGMIDTEALWSVAPEGVVQAIVAAAPIKRLGRPDDLLGVLELLCSDAGAFITGQTIAVNGGASMPG